MARLEDIAAHGKDKVVTPLDGDPRLVRCMFKNRADKNIEKLDIEIPVMTPRIQREYKKVLQRANKTKEYD